MSKNIMFTLVMPFILLGCFEKEKKKDVYETKSRLEFIGYCSEDHVQVKDKYKGIIRLTLNKTKGTFSTYGYAHKVDMFNLDEELEQIRNPSKYFPPSSITFWDIPHKTFKQKNAVLKGVSSKDGTEDITDGYASTCIVSITKDITNTSKN